jgi:hypothetical protein
MAGVKILSVVGFVMAMVAMVIMAIIASAPYILAFVALLAIARLLDHYFPKKPE